MSDNERDFDDELEEDEEDFEDDDFEDEVEEETPKKKKRKKEVSAASYFLDTEADVDEEAEEDEEEYEKESGEIDWDAAQAEANAAQQNRQLHRRQLYDQDKSVEELAREIEERHKNYTLEDEDLEDDEEAPTELKRTGMLPSVRDPKLWMVHCKPGKERPTVIALMRKFFDPESKLAIKSAIAPSHLKGFVYIEAEKESHVKQAIKGMRTLQEYSLKLVPIKEMADVLTVTRKATAFHKGDWVRVKRGLYKHDIGQVYDVDESRGRVTVKLIPRLDLANMNKPEDGKKVKRQRMPARFFNPDEVNQALGGRSDMDRRVDPYTGEHFYVLMGNRFLNGYLLKPMDVRSLEGGEVQPTLEELKKFQEKPPEGGEETTTSEDIASLASTLKQQRKIAFKKGDTVIVVEGDLKHLMGTVESVDRETVTIRPKHEELHDLLTFPAGQLRKYFKKGDHVKVIAGRFEGETGLIIRVEENAVIIFSDLTNQEIKVFTQDIQECSEVSTGKIKLGNYELHDLVTVGNTVGIITKIERDQFKLLDTTGNIQTVALAAMGTKRNSPKNANTFDANQNTITVGDIVKVTDGQFKGRQGTIKHIFRYFLFLHSREMLENSGIFVVRTSHVTALGAKAKPGDLPGAFPGTSHFPPSSPGPRNLRSPARNAPSGPVSSFDSRKRSFKDTLKDKHVVILRGQWKGYVGIVRDSTETNARIELHTNSKVVTVPRDSVRLKDESAPEGSMQEAFYPPQTPAWGSRTPMREDPSATPMRTPGTPLRAPSTPLRGVPGTPVHGTAWDASIPNTPMRTGNSWEPDYSANWTPSTPGGYGTQFTPYSPARSQYDNTPADNPTTPSALTPGTYDQRTPAMDSTPYSSAYQPNTPGTPGPVTPRGPNTPASEYGEQPTPSSPGRYQWYIPKAEVTVNGELGVIQDVVIEKGMFIVKVLMDNSRQTVSAPADQVQKVVPGKGHAVIIVMGEQKGQTGTLIGIDNEDGIVKMDSNLDIKILDREHLAKYRK